MVPSENTTLIVGGGRIFAISYQSRHSDPNITSVILFIYEMLYHHYNMHCHLQINIVQHSNCSELQLVQ